jgi:hypothetical protein
MIHGHIHRLVYVEFLEEPSNSTNLVGAISNAVAVKMGIKYNAKLVHLICVDNASYAIKGADLAASLLSPAQRFGCLAHVLDLCGNVVFAAFPLLLRIFKLLKKGFRSNLVKNQYRRFLARDVRQVLMPPFMNETRWYSTYIMVYYL